MLCMLRKAGRRAGAHDFRLWTRPAKECDREPLRDRGEKAGTSTGSTRVAIHWRTP